MTGEEESGKRSEERSGRRLGGRWNKRCQSLRNFEWVDAALRRELMRSRGEIPGTWAMQPRHSVWGDGCSSSPDPGPQTAPRTDPLDLRQRGAHN